MEKVGADGKPIVKEVFIADDKYTTLKIPYVTSREYTEGIYGDNMDNITWGDLTSDAQPSNTPDIRDGVYENNKDSVSWEDLLAGATDIPAAQTES
jgi:hypothetical protein